MRCLALLALLVPAAALRATPLTSAARRQALATGASLVPGLVLLPQLAHADAIEDIAARQNAAAEKAREAKAKAKAAGPGFLAEATGSVASVALPAVLLGFVGFAAVFAADITSKSGIAQDLENRGRRPLTEAEKRKYKNLSPKEKRELGIKGL